MKTKLNTKPDFKTEVKMMCNAIVEIDNPFLQKLADAGAIVMSSGSKGFWVLTGVGQLWLKIHEEAMHLECIAVRDDERRQGNGSKLMNILVEIADETQIPITLEVSIVTSGNYMGIPHPVVGIGQSTKNKIPVRSLPKWYGKFGFQKTEGYTDKKRSMIYLPR